MENLGKEYICCERRNSLPLVHPFKLTRKLGGCSSESTATSPNRPSFRRKVLGNGYIAISLAGLFMLAVLVFDPSKKLPVGANQLDKQVTLALFMVICTFGIVAGLYPSKISSITYFRKPIQQPDQSKNSSETFRELKGHHPTCKNYSSHVLNIQGKSYCAGCSGLVLGAAISIVGSPAETFSLIPSEYSNIMFWVGIVAVVLGLFQYSITSGALMHSVLNISFVLGAFLLVSAVIEATRNPLVEGLALILSVFLIVSRIMLSQLEHDRICSECNLESCGYVSR